MMDKDRAMFGVMCILHGIFFFFFNSVCSFLLPLFYVFLFFLWTSPFFFYPIFFFSELSGHFLSFVIFSLPLSLIHCFVAHFSFLFFFLYCSLLFPFAHSFHDLGICIKIIYCPQYLQIIIHSCNITRKEK